MILDTGVFIALDKPSKRGVIQALMTKMMAEGVRPATNEAVLAQCWRHPASQVPMSMLIKSVSVHPFGDAKTIGRRCAVTRTSDVVDASLAVLADQLDETILTTDPKDMSKLGAAFSVL